MYRFFNCPLRFSNLRTVFIGENFPIYPVSETQEGDSERDTGAVATAGAGAGIHSFFLI